MIHDKGAITLDPPGISMNVGDLWLGLSTASAQ
jgi:hypothetical protein